MSRPARPAPRHPDLSAKRKAHLNSSYVKTPLGILVGKTQDTFEAQGEELATAFGWIPTPNPDDPKADPLCARVNDIQVIDARRFFTKTLHEVHVAAINGHAPPTAESVLSHLGLDEGEYAADDLALLKQTLSEVAAVELAEHRARLA